MNLSTLFFDRLSRTDSNLAINGKKSIDANFFFSDLIKVFEDENHSSNDLQDISIDSSSELFSQQEKVINLSGAEFNSISNIISSLINKEKEIDVESNSYKLEDVEISKEHFIVNQDKLISLLSAFFNANGIQFNDVINTKVNEEKPIQLTFKSDVNKISISINPIKLIPKSNFENDEKILLASKILTDSIYLKDISNKLINEKESNPSDLNAQIQIVNDSAITNNQTKYEIENFNEQIFRENEIVNNENQSDSSVKFDYELNEINYQTKADDNKIIDINLPENESKENATQANQTISYKNGLNNINENPKPIENYNIDANFFKIEIVKLISTTTNENKIQNKFINDVNLSFNNENIFGENKSEANIKNDLINIDLNDDIISNSKQETKSIPWNELLNDLTDEEKSVFKNFQTENEIRSFVFSKNEIVNENNNSTEFLNTNQKKTEDDFKVERPDNYKGVNQFEPIKNEIKELINNNSLKAVDESISSNTINKGTISFINEKPFVVNENIANQNASNEKVVFSKEQKVLKFESDLEENKLSNEEDKTLLNVSEKLTTKIKSSIKENNLKGITAENNNEKDFVSKVENKNDENLVTKLNIQEVDETNIQDRSKIKSEQKTSSNNNVIEVENKNELLIDKNSELKQTKSNSSTDTKNHNYSITEKINNNQNNSELTQTDDKKNVINVDEKISKELKRQLNLNKEIKEEIEQTDIAKSIAHELKKDNEKTIQVSTKENDKTLGMNPDEKINPSSEKNSADSKNNFNSNSENQKNEINQLFVPNNHEFEKIKQSFESKSFYELSRPIKQEEIIPEFSKFIQQGEKQTISFQLTPENLGKVNLIVDLVDNVISTKIEVENEQVKQFIQSNIEQLKSNLQSNGIQLNNINISLADYSQKQNQKVYNEKKKYNSRIEKEEKIEETSSPKMKKNLGYNTLEFLA